jgi:hypothetical protein
MCRNIPPLSLRNLAAGHPFVETLRRWKEGIPVDCRPDWEWNVVEAAVAQGPHRSALSPDSIELFQEDVAYQVETGFCKTYSWEEVQRLRPPRLKYLQSQWYHNGTGEVESSFRQRDNRKGRLDGARGRAWKCGSAPL